MIDEVANDLDEPILAALAEPLADQVGMRMQQKKSGSST